MKYECIKIVDTDSGEIVYVLDTETGIVSKNVVNDNTGHTLKPINKIRKWYDRVAEEEVGEDIIQNERPRVDVKTKSKPMMPPALAGVFLPQDTPGAAVETRRI